MLQIEGAEVFVDFTKESDSLEWYIMLSTLRQFGFNALDIRWMKYYIVIYKHVL